MTEAELKPWDAAYDDAYGPTYSTKKAPALSRVPRGVWRNVYRYAPGRAVHKLPNARTWLDDFHYLGEKPWPCKDSAETAAARQAAERPYLTATHIWIEAKFFPDA